MIAEKFYLSRIQKENMMKKLTILVDMDDTIEQLLQAWVRGAN